MVLLYITPPPQDSRPDPPRFEGLNADKPWRLQLSDTLLSVLAIRSQEVVSSIFGPQVEHSNGVHHEEASQSQNGHHASHQTQLQA